MKTPQKKRDNHVSVRFQEDELEVLTERMAQTGESLSVALRNIVRESKEKGGSVHLSPKAPPEHLEVLLGELRKWRAAFATAKPRLNMATPASDDERYSQVIAWRKEADRLLAEIPQLEMVVKVALAAVTNLTPERVAILRAGVRVLPGWKQKAVDDNKQSQADFHQQLIDILTDAGITPEE